MCRRRRVLSRTCEFAGDCVFVCFHCSLYVHGSTIWLLFRVINISHRHVLHHSFGSLFWLKGGINCSIECATGCDVDVCCMKIERDLTLPLLQLLLSERLELNVDTVGMGNLINMCRRRRVLLRTCEFAGDCVCFVCVCLCMVQKSDYYFVSNSHRYVIHAPLFQ